MSNEFKVKVLDRIVTFSQPTRINANSEDKLVNCFPINDRDFSYEELSRIVGGYIEVISLSKDWIMIFNEEGKLPHMRLVVNWRATSITRHILASSDLIVGDVLICPRKMVK